MDINQFEIVLQHKIKLLKQKKQKYTKRKRITMCQVSVRKKCSHVGKLISLKPKKNYQSEPSEEKCGNDIIEKDYESRMTENNGFRTPTSMLQYKSIDKTPQSPHGKRQIFIFTSLILPEEVLLPEL